MATSSDLNLRQFVINTISKANYDQLSAAGQIQQNELYFVDDAPLDAKGAKVSNVAAPELSSDAATKNYVDTEISSAFENVSEDMNAYRAKDDLSIYVREIGSEKYQPTKDMLVTTTSNKYDLISADSIQLHDYSFNRMTLTAESTTFRIDPDVLENDGKVHDFSLEISNAYKVDNIASMASISFNGIGNTYSVTYRKGDVLEGLTKFKANEHAILYFTRIASFGSLPTLLVSKQELA